VGDFPSQPSQKDGLGRMCKPHWNQYTTALRKAALARKAADGGVATEVAPTESEPAALAARQEVGGRRAKEAGAATPEPIHPRAPRKVRGTPPGTATHFDVTPTPAAVDPDAQEDSVA